MPNLSELLEHQIPSTLQILFEQDESGWCDWYFVQGNNHFYIYLSEVYDPFDKIIEWGSQLEQRNLPASLEINEEDSRAVAIVYPTNHQNIARLNISRKINCENHKIELLDTHINFEKFIQDLKIDLKRFFSKAFDIKDWCGHYDNGSTNGYAIKKISHPFLRDVNLVYPHTQPICLNTYFDQARCYVAQCKWWFEYKDLRFAIDLYEATDPFDQIISWAEKVEKNVTLSQLIIQSDASFDQHTFFVVPIVHTDSARFQIFYDDTFESQHKKNYEKVTILDIEIEAKIFANQIKEAILVFFKQDLDLDGWFYHNRKGLVPNYCRSLILSNSWLHHNAQCYTTKERLKFRKKGLMTYELATTELPYLYFELPAKVVDYIKLDWNKPNHDKYSGIYSFGFEIINNERIYRRGLILPVATCRNQALKQQLLDLSHILANFEKFTFNQRRTVILQITQLSPLNKFAKVMSFEAMNGMLSLQFYSDLWFFLNQFDYVTEVESVYEDKISIIRKLQPFWRQKMFNQQHLLSNLMFKSAFDDVLLIAANQINLANYSSEYWSFKVLDERSQDMQKCNQIPDFSLFNPLLTDDIVDSIDMYFKQDHCGGCEWFFEYQQLKFSIYLQEEVDPFEEILAWEQSLAHNILPLKLVIKDDDYRDRYYLIIAHIGTSERVGLSIIFDDITQHSQCESSEEVTFLSAEIDPFDFSQKIKYALRSLFENHFIDQHWLVFNTEWNKRDPYALRKLEHPWLKL